MMLITIINNKVTRDHAQQGTGLGARRDRDVLVANESGGRVNFLFYIDFTCRLGDYRRKILTTRRGSAVVNA